MTGRDPITGRFLSGNQIAKGNKGNRKPKWGNDHAVKHGLFRHRLSWVKVDPDGWLRINKGNRGSVRVAPSDFYVESGAFYVRDEVLTKLEREGWC